VRTPGWRHRWALHPRASDSSGPEGEAGVSLIEMILTLALTAVAAVLVLPAMRVITDASTVIQAQAVDDTIVASTLTPLTNEISSAAVVYSPSPSSGTDYATQDSGTSAGDALLVLSQVGGSYRCQQWAVVSPGELEQRSWLPGATTATPFIPVEAAVYPPATAPFTLVTGTPPAVQLALALRPSAKQVSLTVKTTVNATNVGTSAMASLCETAPVT
jgi:hypothetical protein